MNKVNGLKKYAVLTWILIKRQLKNKAFLGMLILVCLFITLSTIYVKDDKEQIQVALYTYDSELSLDVIKELTSMDSSYNFYLCKCIEELVSDVQKRTAVCGFVFESNFTNELENQNYKKLIQIIINDDKVVPSMISETVYSVIFSQIARLVSEDYINENLSELNIDFEEGFKEYTEGSRVFSVEFIKMQDENNQDAAKNEIESGLFEFSFRNIMALFIFAASLLGAYEYMLDREKGAFDALIYRMHKYVAILYALIPTIMAGIITYLGLILLGNFSNVKVVFESVAKESYAMLFYVVLCGVFASVLTFIIRKSKIYLPVATVLILLSFVACPVIIDIAFYVPVVGVIRKFLIPFYYIKLYL